MQYLETFDYPCAATQIPESSPRHPKNLPRISMQSRNAPKTPLKLQMTNPNSQWILPRTDAEFAEKKGKMIAFSAPSTALRDWLLHDSAPRRADGQQLRSLRQRPTLARRNQREFRRWPRPTGQTPPTLDLLLAPQLEPRPSHRPLTIRVIPLRSLRSFAAIPWPKQISKNSALFPPVGFSPSWKCDQLLRVKAWMMPLLGKSRVDQAGAQTARAALFRPLPPGALLLAISTYRVEDIQPAGPPPNGSSLSSTPRFALITVRRTPRCISSINLSFNALRSSCPSRQTSSPASRKIRESYQSAPALGQLLNY
jgi:hypothetical protein